MISTDALKRKVDELQKQAEEIEELGIKLIEDAPFDTKSYTQVCILNMLDYHSPLKKMQREAILKYQQWYVTAYELINQSIPEWIDRFKYEYSKESLVNGVMDYLNLGIRTNIRNVDQLVAVFVNGLEYQLSILLSIPSVVEVKEMGLRELITADVARTEIEQAELLLEGGFERAAGSIAGVALELHLKTLCDVNGVSYPPKATIEPLAQALYKENKFNLTEFKHIQYLASIRNKCSHPEAVSAKEVRNLIDGVKKLV